MNSFISGFYRANEWVMRFALVNLLWFLFSLLGLVLLGFFPATTAMFAVIRKWIMGRSDISIFETFWHTYRKEWLRSNLFGAILLVIGFLIYFDLNIVYHSSDPLLQWSKYPLLILVISFSLALLYAFPSFVHYNVSLFNVLKNAFLIMLINPVYNVIMLLGLALIYLMANILPPFSIFFGGSAIAFVIMWSCYQSFLTIDRKKAKRKDITKEP
ncbi:Uncharacterized membrane protein YesL [Mesobacillus persicus]|uniref:Uncharacterized membrane protein YesL n=1 Tax=Mesobacillus persicus TaxID=930146 RepID=A0A1H8JVW8_9BACI|nr:YesL family protein [Mesobacillus persicus]SEN84882.1 Uncharacterized membrane protein YesL [Mesobacillus persicus]